jgi:phosphopantetheinyl transferase
MSWCEGLISKGKLKMALDQTQILIEQFLSDSSRIFGLTYEVVDMGGFFRLLNYDRTELSAILSPQELDCFEKFSMPKKKLQWLAGRYAIKRALQKGNRLPKKRLDFNGIDVLSRENSAPYLPQFPDLRISITHSFPYCIGVVSNHAIGVDLEKIMELSGSLIYQYFHPNEIKSLTEKAGTEDYRTRAIIYWTRKEAVSKLLKLGLKMDFKQIDTVKDSVTCKEYNASLIRLISSQMINYCISLAVEEEQIISHLLNG